MNGLRGRAGSCVLSTCSQKIWLSRWPAAWFQRVPSVCSSFLQVASFGIVINQMWSLMDEIFTSDCDYCRGTGRIICRHCHGTKTLRRRPGEFHYQHMAVVDRSPRDL